MSRLYSLDRSFTHRSSSHEYRMQWTQVGTPSAPPLIFIHGTPWSSTVWEILASSLSTRYCIYLFDHPGFGSSPAPRRLSPTENAEMIDLDPSLTLRAEASAAFIKHLALGSSPHVVAHDNGGLVSLRLLLQNDLKFASLCLIDSVAIGPFGLPFFELVADNQKVFSAIPPPLLEGLIRGYVRSAAHRPLPEGVEDMLSAPWLEKGSQGCERFLKEMVQAHNRNTDDIESNYGRVGSLVPTKIIWGKEDAWIPAETAGRLKEALNAEEAVVVDEAGHLIHYDQPSRLAVEVNLWLEKHGKYLK